MSRHRIGRATNDKEPRDTNFPGFTSTGFPIKSRVPAPHSILFSDTIKFPFARAKILTVSLNVVSIILFLTAEGEETSGFPNKPWGISIRVILLEKVGTTWAKRGEGEKRICRGDRGWNQARQPTVLMSNFERGFCQPTWLTISLQSSNVTIGDPTVNGIKGGTIRSKIDLYRFHVLILTTFDCFRCWWNVISWLSYSWLPLFSSFDIRFFYVCFGIFIFLFLSIIMLFLNFLGYE